MPSRPRRDCDYFFLDSQGKFLYSPSPENQVLIKSNQTNKSNQIKKKTKEGVYIQTYMSMAMKALTTAFQKWQKEQLQLEALGQKSTWQMYRRKLKVLNRNKLIVFAGRNLGIFPSHEVFMLANVPVRDTEKGLNIKRDQLYAKYSKGVLTENS